VAVDLGLPLVEPSLFLYHGTVARRLVAIRACVGIPTVYSTHG
jgi:hypothetical protein